MMLLGWIEGDARVAYQLARLDLLDEWWHWIVLLLVLILVISYTFFWYRRDWVEIPRPLGATLLFLRLAALLGIFFFFLDLQKRTEQKIVRPSRVAVLVDTSLSMTLPKEQNEREDASRIAAVVDSIEKSEMLERLRAEHDTTVYRFDQTSRPQPVASFPKLGSIDGGSGDPSQGRRLLWQWVSWVAWVGASLGALGLLLLACGMLARFRYPQSTVASYCVLSGTVGTLMSLIIVGTATLRSTELPIRSLWNREYVDAPVLVETEKDPAKPGDSKRPRDYPWKDLLVANGTETRLGDAVKSLLETERGLPLAGIVVFTDGQNTMGIDPTASLPDAVVARVPIMTVGLGSEKNPSNARVVEVEAPKRVFPGDRFRLTVLLQASGLQGKRATVQLRSSPSQKSDQLKIEEEQGIDLPDDETILPVHFEVLPKEIGEWNYEVKLIPPSEDKTPADNTMDALVRVIQPKFKVLTIAGGPTREYQFVRNMLFREDTVQSHVYLQTGGPGISQEAHQLLEDFPKTLIEMAEYDCVIAFDADWMKLEASQLELLEEWVSRQAGGLVIIAGPVATPRWTGTEGNGDRRAEVMRALAPVELNPRGTRLISVGRFEGTSPWPLKFTEDGKRSDFLRVGTNMADTDDAWTRFPGVFSYYATFDPKPGALTLAEFSDPSTANDGKLPIFLASHFFGAGRVVFQGSGEIWRLREMGIPYFDTYYTKLIRWVGQGRLLRDSKRGMLLVESEEAMVGDQVAVRAVLKDSQFQPLLLPQVEARLVDPTQKASPVLLMPLQDATQPGVYLGQFLASAAGTYQMQLTIGGLADQEILTQQVTARVPTREIQRPQRNDPLLQEMATKSQGKYYRSIDEAMVPVAAKENKPQVIADLVPQDQINYLAGAPDREFQQRLMALLMAIIGGSLSMEWLLRRLSKLA